MKEANRLEMPANTPRLEKQLFRIQRLMADGAWRTLKQVAVQTGSPEASASARLRDIRRLGSRVERKCVSRGLFMYRVAPATERKD